MIPSEFEYHAPASVAEAIELLVGYGESAKLLAGGHSLLPMMKLRFAEPGHLVDINRIESLRGVRLEKEHLVIGAMTREVELLESPLIQQYCPLLVLATRQIADAQVRNRGTIGGDIAHGDPGNDHPAVMLALDACFVLQGPEGVRRVAAADFFLGTYWTALAANELLTAVEIPLASAGRAFGFSKMKRKTGDFATAAATVSFRLVEGRCQDTHIALTNAAPCAFRVTRAEQRLEGQLPDDGLLDEVSALVAGSCQPADDLRGDARYKAHMSGEMTRRAIIQAIQRQEDN